MNGSEANVIDLSLCLAEDYPCWWPGHMPFQHKVFNWFVEVPDEPSPLRSAGPYQTRWLLMDEHTGTHFDAPTHSIPPPDSGLPGAGPAGAVSAEKVPLTDLMGPAAVIDVTALVGQAADGESPLIEPVAIEAFERRHGPLEAGDVVLLRSDWDRRYEPHPGGGAYLRDCAIEKTAPGWPSPADATVELLAERGVRCLGTDGVSMGAVHDGAIAHAVGLARGMLFVEGLARLCEMPPRGAFFLFMPIKVRGGTGGPGRAAAFLGGELQGGRSDD
jgi:kynurenine formamidase